MSNVNIGNGMGAFGADAISLQVLLACREVHAHMLALDAALGSLAAALGWLDDSFWSDGFSPNRPGTSEILSFLAAVACLAECESLLDADIVSEPCAEAFGKAVAVLLASYSAANQSPLNYGIANTPGLLMQVLVALNGAAEGRRQGMALLLHCGGVHDLLSSVLLPVNERSSPDDMVGDSRLHPSV